MGLLNKLLGGAEGCREAMRDAYKAHVRAAGRGNPQDSHVVGLFGALGSRYRARGQAIAEAALWGELAPFLAMEPSASILALAEYAALQEHRVGVRESWLRDAINRALVSPVDDTYVVLASIGLANNVAWTGLLNAGATSAIQDAVLRGDQAAAPSERTLALQSDRLMARQVLAPEVANDSGLEDWIRRHPIPQPAFDSRWRENILRFAVNLPRLQSDEEQTWTKDRTALLDVADNFPATGGLSALRPKALSATSQWTRLARKYLGINI